VTSPKWLLFLVLVGTVCAMALFGLHREPAAGRETTNWLAIESAAVDGDRVLAEADRARFAERFGHRPVAAQVETSDGVKRLDAPAAWTAVMATARHLGRRAPAIVQSLLFAVAAGFAFSLLAGVLGESSAALLVLVTLLASAAVLVPVRLEPRVLEMAAMGGACAAVWWRRSRRPAGSPDVFQGSLGRAPSALRWIVSGLLFGVVLAGSPTYLPLAVPLVAAADRERRWSRGLAFALGAALSLGGLAVSSGALWEPIEPILSARLFGWAALGLTLGRGVGLAPYFVPAIFLALAVGGTAGKRWAPLAVVAALVLQVVAAPFDFVEGALDVGNAWFLPPLVLLLCAAESTERTRSMLALAVLSAPFLLPSWLAVVGATTASRQAAQRLAVVGEVLPVPSTLRSIPGAASIERAGLVVQGLAPGLVGGSDGRLRWVGRRAQLVVSSDRAMSSLRLDLGANAPADIEVRGGKLGNTTYRPSGELSIDVLLDPRQARRHPVWMARGEAATYVVELRIGQAPATPIVLDVPFGRGVLPSGEVP